MRAIVVSSGGRAIKGQRIEHGPVAGYQNGGSRRSKSQARPAKRLLSMSLLIAVLTLHQRDLARRRVS